MSSSKPAVVTVDAIAIHAVGPAAELNKLDVMKGVQKVIDNIIVSSAATPAKAAVGATSTAPAAKAAPKKAATTVKKAAPAKPAAKKPAAKKPAPKKPANEPLPCDGGDDDAFGGDDDSEAFSG